LLAEQNTLIQRGTYLRTKRSEFDIPNNIDLRKYFHVLSIEMRSQTFVPVNKLFQ